ncbi:hypothetical protein [Nitrosomonas sp. wSCUT-2]
MQILDFPVTGSRRRWLYSTEGSIGSRYDVVIAAMLRNGIFDGQLQTVIFQGNSQEWGSKNHLSWL